MRTQALLLAAPSAAMAVVGVALFGPGALRPFDGARIRGGPTEGLTHVSWRIAVLQRFRGIDSTHDVGALFVRARSSEGAEAVAHCRTRADGTCDIDLVFPAPLHGTVHALITTEPAGTPLVEGDFMATEAVYQAAVGHRAHLRGTTGGTLELDVYAKRGVFAAPFRDELVVVVRHAGGPLASATVDLRTDAADLDPLSPPKDGAPSPPDALRGAVDAEAKATVVTTADGRATFGITPRMHSVDVTLRATGLGLEGTWTAILPVVPGALWLDPARLAEGKIRVVAPVPREVAYATITTSKGRLWGGVIPLSSDVRGFATGEIDGPDIGRMPLEDAWLTLASDPLASGSGTVGWPLPHQRRPDEPGARDNEIARDERPFRDELLLDGLPAAQEADQNRRYRARGLAALALGAAAVLEGVLLAQSSRKGGPRAWGWTAMAIATVALAFAAVGVVVVWKTSG